MRWLAGCVGALLAIDSAGAAERVVRGDGIVAGSVNNVPARIRIEPGAVAMPMVTSDVARRARLKAGPFNFEYLIGPRRVTGRSAVTRIDFGSGPVRRRVAWTEAPYRPGVDGVIGPGMLPEDVIRFALRSPRAGERVTTLPMVGQGGLDGRWGQRFAVIEVGGKPMRIQFDPARPRTVATANAGARLAAAYGGRLEGPAEAMEIEFGIERPVRALRLERPLAIGSLSLNGLRVRTRDFGTTAAIADTSASAPDPNEIVVIGTKENNKIFDYISLGADQLDACSSITFDKAAKQIRLSCL